MARSRYELPYKLTVCSYLGYHELFRGRLYDDRLPGLVWHRIRFHGVAVISMMVVIIMVNGVPVVVLLKHVSIFYNLLFPPPHAIGLHGHVYSVLTSLLLWCLFLFLPPLLPPPPPPESFLGPPELFCGVVAAVLLVFGANPLLTTAASLGLYWIFS